VNPRSEENGDVKRPGGAGGDTDGHRLPDWCLQGACTATLRRGSPLHAKEEEGMDPTLVGAMSGVLGSLVGGSATVATAWITQRTLNKRELVREELRRREALYGEFIGESAKLLMDAFTHTLEKPETFLPFYALLSRIRLSASDDVLAEAERLLTRITEQYFSSNLTVEEIRQLARSEDTDPLRPFGEACRVELKSMRGRV
jgi:hypothetical protein